MFDNVAFEVVFGLVFIYLLYSLLVTILGEIISTRFGIRARLLRIAIERMFNDGYYQKIEEEKLRERQGWFRRLFLYVPRWVRRIWIGLIGWFRRVFLYESDEFKTSFAGRFYEYPAIKYIGRIDKYSAGAKAGENERYGVLSKPSYISADYFADSLISFLADKGTGSTEMEKVGLCLKFNTYQIQPKTLRQFRNLYESAGGNKSLYKVNIIKWFNETMDRTNGWHKRKMRFISFWIGFVIAMGFNVDSIKIAKILANDKEARNQLVNMGVALAKDSARFQDFISNNGDTFHTKAVLDTGFARITKDINAANLILGLGWPMDNLQTRDSVTVTDTIITKKDTIVFKDLKSELDTLIKKRTAKTSSLNALSVQLKVNKYKLDSLNVVALMADPLTRDTIQAEQMKRQRAGILAGMKRDSSALAMIDFLTQPLYEQVNRATGKKFIFIDSIGTPDKEGKSKIYGKRYFNGSDKFFYVIAHIFWYSLLGFFLTALALSLGAPFWFDMLNKLVAIRGVGVKPEEKKEPLKNENISVPVNQPDVVPPAVLNSPRIIAGDFIDLALITYGPPLRSIPGVKSVFKGFDRTKGAKWLQINVASETTRKVVERRFPKIKVDDVIVSYKIVISGLPQTNDFNFGEICNASKRNGSGSLGCVLENVQTKSRHLLSCWHVLKGNIDYDNDDDLTLILNHENHTIASRWAGGIFENFDFALAQLVKDGINENNKTLFDKLDIKSLSEIRHLSGAEINNQISVKYYDSLNQRKQTGKIVTDTPSVEITYRDKTRAVKDLLVLTDDSNNNPISQPGNSGSVVFDSKGQAVAMIIAGDDNYTYAMKLAHILPIHKEMKILN